jgi:hypothetical protein
MAVVIWLSICLSLGYSLQITFSQDKYYSLLKPKIWAEKIYNDFA